MSSCIKAIFCLCSSALFVTNFLVKKKEGKCIRAVFISGFLGIKLLALFLFPWTGCQSISYFPALPGTHLYSWVERSTYDKSVANDQARIGTHIL